MPDEAKDEEPSSGGLSAWQVVASTIAAAFGVQSSANRKRDFSQGKASHFIFVGIAFTVVFVIGMVLFVRFVLSAAGA